MTRRRQPLRHYLEAYAFLGLLVAAAIFFSLWPETGETFTSAANLRTLVASNSVIAIVALGALVPLVCYEFDLSVGAIAGLSSVYVATALVARRFGPAGPGAGDRRSASSSASSTRLLITRVGVNAVISTLGMSIILHGIVNQKTGGLSVTGNIPAQLQRIRLQQLARRAEDRLSCLAARRARRLLPARPHAASGAISTPSAPTRGGTAGRDPHQADPGPDLRHLRRALRLGRACCRWRAAAAPTRKVGETFTLPALAAAFLSAAAIKPGRYNVGGTMVAIFFLAVLNSGLNLAGRRVRQRLRQRRRPDRRGRPRRAARPPPGGLSMNQLRPPSTKAGTGPKQSGAGHTEQRRSNVSPA